jgi:prepilin-type N-terminal cleavage/methylation domain-containing protein
MHELMNKRKGFSLLELMIALALSAILFFTVDSVYASLWKTRTLLEKEHEAQRARQLIQAVFSDPLFHAGILGCRSVKDGISIRTKKNMPNSFFIQEGEAVRVESGQLKVHETHGRGVMLQGPVPENSTIAPAELRSLSDWLLISDCFSAELLPYGGKTELGYQSPIYVFPVIIQAWSIRNNTLYTEQVYPPKQAQPMLDGVTPWEWTRFGSLLRLVWQEELWIFELGNS